MDFLHFVLITAPYLLIALCVAVLIAAHRTVRELAHLVDVLLDHQERMKQRGIYMIECKPTQTTYYGSTKVSFHSRWGQHIAILMRNRHDNPRLQQDWNIYGPTAFQFFVVEVIGDIELIEPREREILQYRALHVLPAMNYNINHSRVYAVPATPELDPSPIVQPKRTRRVSWRHGTDGRLTEEEWDGLFHDIELSAEDLIRLRPYQPMSMLKNTPPES